MTAGLQIAPQPERAFASPHQDPCGGFMAIPPTILGRDGNQYINPDFDYVKRFHLAAIPFGGADGTLGPGESRDFALTVPAEENHLGDLLVSELLAGFRTVGGAAVTGIFTEILSFQSDRLYMNAPVENTHLFGDSFLNCCLPCCFLIQATNTVILRVTNTEAVDVECFFVARGKRFLPYHYPELRHRYLAYWNTIPATPYYLTLDAQQVTVPAGATVAAPMTVPGGGDFEVLWPRITITPAGAGTDPDFDVLVSVAEGVGRVWESQPIQAQLFEATPTRAVAGFPNGGTYQASQACPCPQVGQLFKRNTRVRATFTNNGADDVVIRFTMAGCMHYVSECPPGNALDRIRSLEPTVGPMLVQEGTRCPPYQEMQPVPGYGMVPVQQGRAPGPPITGPGGQFLQVPGGGGQVYNPMATAQAAYLNKYYTLDQHGRVVPKNAAAHGMQGLNGGGHQWGRL